MGSLTWCEDYSVHIRSIDNEHKLLIELMKDLDHALETEGAVRSQLVSSALERLTQCISAHFESEERFLSLNNYPELEGHQQEHNDLLKKLELFVAQTNSGELLFTAQRLLFLKDWLMRHIILHDCKFGRYYNARGLTSF